MRRIRATIVAVENNKYYIGWVQKKIILFEILRDSVTNRDEIRPEQNVGYK
jgi:hypothetical protein